MNISTTYIAGIVSVIVFVLPLFGFEIADEGTLTDLVTQIVGTFSTLYVFIGRYHAGGINAFGIRKADK